jgi:hypothetical protein
MGPAFVKAGLGKACYFTSRHAAAAWSNAEAQMRQAIYISALAAFFTMQAAAGKADSWCIRDKAGTIAPICAFSSSADCIRAALVGPSGSVCVQEGTPAAKLNDRTEKPAERGWRREADRDFFYR